MHYSYHCVHAFFIHFHWFYRIPLLFMGVLIVTLYKIYNFMHILTFHANFMDKMSSSDRYDIACFLVQFLLLGISNVFDCAFTI